MSEESDKPAVNVGDLCRVTRESPSFVIEVTEPDFNPRRTLYGIPGSRTRVLSIGSVALVLREWQSDCVIVSCADELLLVDRACLERLSEPSDEGNGDTSGRQ